MQAVRLLGTRRILKASVRYRPTKDRIVVVAEQTRLAAVLEEWIDRQRVQIAHIQKAGGVSRNTINLIQNGITTRPEAETVRKIARGLAADPKTGKVDRPVYIAALRDLCRAAGLPDLTQDIPPCDLEDEIRAIVKDRSRASFLAAFIRKYPDITPGERNLVHSVLDSLGREDSPA